MSYHSCNSYCPLCGGDSRFCTCKKTALEDRDIPPSDSLKTVTALVNEMHQEHLLMLHALGEIKDGSEPRAAKIASETISKLGLSLRTTCDKPIPPSDVI